MEGINAGSERTVYGINERTDLSLGWIEEIISVWVHGSNRKKNNGIYNS